VLNCSYCFIQLAFEFDVQFLAPPKKQKDNP
jgi:hypothetical protein